MKANPVILTLSFLGAVIAARGAYPSFGNLGYGLRSNQMVISVETNKLNVLSNGAPMRVVFFPFQPTNVSSTSASQAVTNTTGSRATYTINAGCDSSGSTPASLVLSNMTQNIAVQRTMGELFNASPVSETLSIDASPGDVIGYILFPNGNSSSIQTNWITIK